MPASAKLLKEKSVREQACNRRNSLTIEKDGQVIYIAKEFKPEIAVVKYSTYLMRVMSGWNVNEAQSTPAKKYKKPQEEVLA